MYIQSLLQGAKGSALDNKVAQAASQLNGGFNPGFPNEDWSSNHCAHCLCSKFTAVNYVYNE